MTKVDLAVAFELVFEVSMPWHEESVGKEGDNDEVDEADCDGGSGSGWAEGPQIDGREADSR